jgi:hypothetical protein
MCQVHPDLIFKVLQRRDTARIPGTAPAQSAKEAPVAELSADDAVCLFKYEFSYATITNGLIAVAGAMGLVSGMGVGDSSWRG